MSDNEKVIDLASHRQPAEPPLDSQMTIGWDDEGEVVVRAPEDMSAPDQVWLLMSAIEHIRSEE